MTTTTGQQQSSKCEGGILSREVWYRHGHGTSRANHQDLERVTCRIAVRTNPQKKFMLVWRESKFNDGVQPSVSLPVLKRRVLSIFVKPSPYAPSVSQRVIRKRYEFFRAVSHTTQIRRPSHTRKSRSQKCRSRSRVISVYDYHRITSLQYDPTRQRQRSSNSRKLEEQKV